MCKKQYAAVSAVVILGLLCFIGYGIYASRPYNEVGKYNIVVINNSGENLNLF